MRFFIDFVLVKNIPITNVFYNLPIRKKTILGTKKNELN